MPDFGRVHETRADPNTGQTVIVRSNPHVRFNCKNFECVIQNGQFWQPDGSGLLQTPVEKFPEEFIDFLESLTDEEKDQMGFVDGNYTPEPVDALYEAVKAHGHKDDIYYKGKPSLKFFSRVVGSKITRETLDEAWEKWIAEGGQPAEPATEDSDD